MHSESKIISILGFGHVGRTIMNLLLSHESGYEINVMDPSEDISGSLLDLGQAAMLSKKKRIYVNNRSKLNDSDFIFHCAGVSIPEGRSREYAMHENIHITREIFEHFEPYRDPIIIVVSNPVDVIAEAALRASRLKPDRVIGIGTMIDSLRLAYYFKSAMGDEAETTSAMVIGEHGDSMVPVLSHSFVSGVPVLEKLPIPVIEDCIYECRHAAQRIKKTQGATYYAAAQCAVEIMNQIINPSDVIHTVSMSHSINDKYRLFYSLPVKFTKRGYFKLEGFELTQEENEGLHISIQKIKANLRQCFAQLEQNH